MPENVQLKTFTETLFGPIARGKRRHYLGEDVNESPWRPRQDSNLQPSA